MSNVRAALLITTLNLLALLVASVLHGSFASAQATAQVLRGRAFELVDDRGQIRARLNVESSGEVVFRLLDERGTIRVKLGANHEGSGLLLANDATEPGVHLLAKATGSSMRVVNKDGRERLVTP
jgi:hypothetical protein